MSRNLKRRPLVEQLIDRLTADIVDGHYAIGAKLPPEAELQALFGVGRSTVREGVRVLAHAGVLEVRPGDGTYVLKTWASGAEPLARRLRRARAREVYEVRGALEIEAAQLAAVRRERSDLVHLRTCLDRRAEAMNDSDAFIQADLDFHLGVASATRNAVLVDMTAEFFLAARDALSESATLPGIRQEGHALHVRLYEQIAARDPDGAKAALQALVVHTTARLTAALHLHPEGDEAADTSDDQ